MTPNFNLTSEVYLYDIRLQPKVNNSLMRVCSRNWFIISKITHELAVGMDKILRHLNTKSTRTRIYIVIDLRKVL